jgi:hypothetical protein
VEVKINVDVSKLQLSCGRAIEDFVAQIVREEISVSISNGLRQMVQEKVTGKGILTTIADRVFKASLVKETRRAEEACAELLGSAVEAELEAWGSTVDDIAKKIVSHVMGSRQLGNHKKPHKSKKKK